MIDERLRNLILPYLKMELPKGQHRYIDAMLEEAVITHDEDGELVSVPIIVSSGVFHYICLQFSTLNGAYYGTEMWHVAKQKGSKA